VIEVNENLAGDGDVSNALGRAPVGHVQVSQRLAVAGTISLRIAASKIEM
jgi:hypothetical protein